MALGVALAGSTVGVFLWNRNQAQDAEASLQQLKNDPQAVDHYEQSIAHNQSVDSIRRGNYITVGLAVAAGASLAGGFYLWHRDRAAGEGRRTSGLTAWGDARAAGLAAGLAWNGSW
jgi:hypothetical protein